MFFGGGRAFACSVVEKAEHDEDGGGESDEIDGFTFVEWLYFASSESLIMAKDLSGAVETGSAAVCEAGV